MLAAKNHVLSCHIYKTFKIYKYIFCFVRFSAEQK